jgi:hypothetical protein
VFSSVLQVLQKCPVAVILTSSRQHPGNGGDQHRTLGRLHAVSLSFARSAASRDASSLSASCWKLKIFSGVDLKAAKTGIRTGGKPGRVKPRPDARRMGLKARAAFLVFPPFSVAFLLTNFRRYSILPHYELGLGKTAGKTSQAAAQAKAAGY